MLRKLLVFSIFFLLSACSIFPAAATQVPGILKGEVTVGPLQPVERIGVPTPTVPPQVYTTRGIEIYRQDGKTLVKSLYFSPDGSYQVELAPGKYVVRLMPTGIDHAGELPADVTIQSGETVTLNIDIDTGIR
jgi:hypothetical protein